MGEMTDSAPSTAEPRGPQPQSRAQSRAQSTAQSRGQAKGQASDWLDKAIRIGLVCYGIVHLLIAWLAFQLALCDHEGQPSAKGAMQQLAEQPFGEVLLWAIAVGMFFLVIWRLLEAVV